MYATLHQQIRRVRKWLMISPVKTRKYNVTKSSYGDSFKIHRILALSLSHNSHKTLYN